MIPDSQEWVVAEKPTGLVGLFGQKRGHLTPGWQTKRHSQGFLADAFTTGWHCSLFV